MKTTFQILYYLACVPVLYYLFLMFVEYKKRMQKEQNPEQNQTPEEIKSRGKLLFKRFVISLVVAGVLLLIFNFIP